MKYLLVRHAPTKQMVIKCNKNKFRNQITNCMTFSTDYFEHYTGPY